MEVHCGLRAQCPGTSGAGACDAAEASGRATLPGRPGCHFGAWGRGRRSARATACPQQQYQNGDAEESHAQFLKALQNAVSTFVNRMKSNHVRGRSITNDSAVLSLFQSINGMHPQLLELLNQLDERRRTCPGPPPPPRRTHCALGASRTGPWLCGP